MSHVWRPAPIDAGGEIGDSVCLECGCLLWFVRKAVGDVVILTFLPGLMTGLESEGRAAEVLAAAGMSPRCVLDLSCLRVMSSLFLAMLIKVQHGVAAAEGQMKICGLDATGQEIMRSTKLDTLFEILGDEQSTVRSFARG